MPSVRTTPESTTRSAIRFAGPIGPGGAVTTIVVVHWSQSRHPRGWWQAQSSARRRSGTPPLPHMIDLDSPASGSDVAVPIRDELIASHVSASPCPRGHPASAASPPRPDGRAPRAVGSAPDSAAGFVSVPFAVQRLSNHLHGGTAMSVLDSVGSTLKTIRSIPRRIFGTRNEAHAEGLQPEDQPDRRIRTGSSRRLRRRVRTTHRGGGTGRSPPRRA